MRRWIARWSRAKRAGPDGQRPDIFGDRCEFGDREIVVDQDRHAATRLSVPNSAVFKSPASKDSVLR
jgi:hypothetical protein